MTDALHIRPARPEDAAAMARIQVDSYRGAYAGIFPRDYLDQFSYDDQASDWLALLGSATSDVILVAETADAQLAGYAVGRPLAACFTLHDSELVSLHVRRAFHHQGIGRALVSGIASSLAASGCRAMMFWVLEANPARGFYERLGAIQLEGRKLTANASEAAYGWPDIRRIASPDGTP